MIGQIKDNAVSAEIKTIGFDRKKLRVRMDSHFLTGMERNRNVGKRRVDFFKRND